MVTAPKHPPGETPAPAPDPGPGRATAFPVLCALLLGALLLAEAALRPRAGSPDAYQYLDVATNLAEGRGLVQSVPGYNAARFPAEPHWPEAFTSQPPLYPWLASLGLRLGLEPTAALSVLSAKGVLLTWLAGAWLATWVWGGTAGVLALAGLAACSLSPALTARVWSDPLAIGLTLCSLVALLAAGRADPSRHAWPFAAGLFAGLAFLTRYVCGLLLPFGVVWLLCVRPFGSRWRKATAFGLTAAVVALPLVVRNITVSGGPFGEPRNPSTQDLGALFANAVQFTWGRVPIELRWGLFAGMLVTLAAVLISKERSQRVREAFRAGSALVPAWALTYALALVAVRLRVHFDNVGVRLLAPAIVAGALLAAGIVTRLVRVSRTLVNVAISLVLLAAAGHVAHRITHTTRPARIEASHSEFMTWLRQEAPPGAALLSEDGVDFAWALRQLPGEPRRIASFSPAPYMRPLTSEDFARFAGQALAPKAPPLYVIVRGEEADDDAWRRRYGDVIADAVAGRTPDGDGLVLERVLEGKRILRWHGRRPAP